MLSKRRATLLLAVALFAFVIQLLIPGLAFAASCDGMETTVLQCDPNSPNGAWDLLLTAIRILTAGVGIAAVGGIVYGSFLYARAGDNAAQVQQATSTIRNVAIGLVLFVGMYAVLEFVIPGGLFNRTFNFPVARAPSTGNNPSNGSNNSSGDNDNDNDKEAQFKFATYNILGFDHNSSASRYGKEDRMRRAARILRERDVKVFVANEINAQQQRTLLLQGLSDWNATGLQSGNQDVLIFWDTSVFKLLNSGAYTIPVRVGHPQRPQPWAKLEHRESDKKFFVFGAHLAKRDANINQRIGAEQVVAQIRNKAVSSNLPFILAGDMNTNDSLGYYAYNIFKGSNIMLYTRYQTGDKTGDNCDTHHHLGRQECRASKGSHIDHIWVSKSPKIHTESYTVVANEETAHVSDHNPVIVKLRIPKSN